MSEELALGEDLALGSQGELEGIKRPKYSVVIPCFRSEESLPELIDRLATQFGSMGEDYEIICVDDASPDALAEVVRKAQASNERVSLIRHVRNYGQHHALITGLRRARGDYVITMDDDLQHPPEEIPRLVEALGGADVVMGVPDSRKHRGHRNAGSFLVKQIVRLVFRPPAGFESSAFRLMKSPVARQLALSPTVYPYISGMILQFTPRVVTVRVRHEPRKFGRSTYSIRKLLSLASNLIINYTKLPLHLLTGIGALISILSFAMIMYVVVSRLFIRDFQAGWPSLIVVISFFGGLNLIALAIIGEYLIRLLNEVERTKRPVLREALEDR